MSGTLSHAKSELITREQLFAIPSPASTSTWKPIAHGDLIHAIDRQLLVRGITIQREQFAIQREGARLFAVLDLSLETTGQFCAALGIRTSNDRSMALEIAVGVKVFVCDNLAFSGDLIAMRRKHTAQFDLNADISRAIDRYQTHLTVLHAQVGALAATPLADHDAKLTIFEAFNMHLLPLRFFPVITETYFHPTPLMTDVQPRTQWALHNAFTRAIKQMAPAPAFQATTRLGKLFGLGGPPHSENGGAP